MLLNLSAQAEEDFMREQQRQEANTRSEADHAAKIRSMETKSAEKEALLRRKRAENEEMRRLRSEVRTWGQMSRR